MVLSSRCFSDIVGGNYCLVPIFDNGAMRSALGTMPLLRGVANSGGGRNFGKNFGIELEPILIRDGLFLSGITEIIGQEYGSVIPQLDC